MSASDDDAARRRTSVASKRLSKHADVAYYTTSVAVQDLERVRAALGYERINLYGGSYGTRVAQHYLRRFPQRARAVILDGVVRARAGPRPRHRARRRERASERVRALRPRRRLQQALRRSGGDVPGACATSLASETRGRQPFRSDHRRAALSRVRRASPGGGAAARRLTTPSRPRCCRWLLHLAQRAGDFAPLAAQFLLTVRKLGDVIAYGMHNTVVCTEDVPFYKPENIDRAELQAPSWAPRSSMRCRAFAMSGRAGPSMRTCTRRSSPTCRCCCCPAATIRSRRPRTPSERSSGLHAQLHLVLRRPRPRPARRALHGPRDGGLPRALGTVVGLDTSCTSTRETHAVLHHTRRPAAMRGRA